MLHKITSQRRFIKFFNILVACLIVSIVSLTGTIADAGNQIWTPTGGRISGAIVRAMAAQNDESIIYAGTVGGGMYESYDQGIHWAKNTALGIMYIWSIAINPTDSETLYVGGDWGGFCHTTDGGSSWKGLPLPVGGHVYSIAIHPSSPTETLYLGTGGGGVLEGIYNEEEDTWNWEQKNEGLDNLVIGTVLIDPNVPDTLYAGSGNGIYRSTNAGEEWSQIFPHHEIRSLVALPTEPTTLYAGTNGGVLKSIDGGDTWEYINEGLESIDVRSIAIDSQNSNVLYATTLAGVHRIENGCQYWLPTNSTEDMLTDIVYTLLASPQATGKVYAGTLLGVYITSDMGDNWTITEIDMPLSVSSLAVEPLQSNVIYAGGDTVGLYKTTDGGATWMLNPLATARDSLLRTIAINPQNPMKIYVGTLFGMGEGCYVSDDGGITWNRTFSGCIGAIALDSLNPSSIYLGTWSSLFHSNNGGEDWNPINILLPAHFIKGIAIHPTNSDIVLLATEGNGVYRTLDGGATWTTANTGLDNLQVFDIVADIHNPDVFYLGTSYGVINGVYRSSNNGETWQFMSEGLDNRSIHQLLMNPVDFRRIYVQVYWGGVFRTVDGGNNWTELNDGFPNPAAIKPLATTSDGITLYAGGAGEVFEYTEDVQPFNLVIEPDPFYFGIVRIGQSKTKSIVITNNGGEDAIEIPITCNNPQVIFEPNIVDVLAGDSTEINVRLNAIVEGQLSATITAGGIGGATATLTADIRPLIGDLSGNGSVSAYDAALILQYVIGFIDEFPCETMQIAQNAMPASYTLSIPDKFTKAGETIFVPIQIDNASVIAGALTLRYDKSILRANRVLSDTLSNCYWQSKIVDDQIRVAFARIDQVEPVRTDLFLVEFDVLANTSGHESMFSFDDVTLAESLSIMLRNGKITIIPDKSLLLQNYPNPFNPDTWLPYQLAENSKVTITIYNQNGQLIRSFNIGDRQAGSYISKDKAAYWDGKNSFGEKVTSGVYFYTLHAGEFAATRRMLIVK